MSYNEILTTAWLHALGWTLLHSLWQGAVLASLLAGALALLRGRSSNARYATACSALALMLIFPAVTFWVVSGDPLMSEVDESSSAASVLEVKQTASAPSAAPDVTRPGGTTQAGLQPNQQTWPGRIEVLLPWLALAWALGVCLLTARMLGGLAYARRLRRCAQPAAEEWQERLMGLSRKLRVSRGVRLLESSLVQVPTAIGWLRPAILLPASAVTGLTPRQLEVIIAHELAHVRRHDYLVNLFQTIAETLLFYHPAVWWVSRRVRVEREHVCDDMAVAVCGDAVLYARALTRMERLRGEQPQFALAADGGDLRARVLRLVGGSQTQRGGLSFLACTIVLAALVTTAAGARAALSQKQGVTRGNSSGPARVSAGAEAEAQRGEGSAGRALNAEVAALIAGDDTTGEDMETRRAALAALGGRAGTVVVMDPRDGRIYAVVNQEWAARRVWSPASTMKLVTGLAGVGERVFEPAARVKVGDRAGRIDLTDALAISNNVYFTSLGERVGAERIISYARRLGLGELTGVNYAGEGAGRLPTFKAGLDGGRLGAYGEGVEVTPVQLATMIAAIANGGSLVTPRVPRTRQEAENFTSQVRRQLDIPREALAQVSAGMVAAVERGTASGAGGAGVKIAGKTGTLSAKDSSVGIFASYAPADDPRLVVVVLTRGEKENGAAAASVAGTIYRALESRL